MLVKTEGSLQSSHSQFQRALALREHLGCGRKLPPGELGCSAPRWLSRGDRTCTGSVVTPRPAAISTRHLPPIVPIATLALVAQDGDGGCIQLFEARGAGVRQFAGRGDRATPAISLRQPRTNPWPRSPWPRSGSVVNSEGHDCWRCSCVILGQFHSAYYGAFTSGAGAGAGTCIRSV